MSNTNINHFAINNRSIGISEPTYFIAELSCNHLQKYDLALELLYAAHKAGADAVKLQIYRPDTITIDCDRPEFQIEGTIWHGQNLFQLYQKTFTPWEWTKPLMIEAKKLGMDLFASPFDLSAVDFLEQCDVAVYKIASFEIIDHPLLKKIAQTKKPVIMSTGMASLSDISEAVDVLRANGTTQLAILKCTSAYPADPKDANLLNIPNLAQTFGCVVGLSDHTLGIEVPIVSTVLGARIIEKHFTLSRESGSADDQFSLLPDEFAQMIKSVRIAEKALGKITYGGVKSESETKRLRRSLFVVEDIAKGEPITKKNVRSIRPGHGLHPKNWENITNGEMIARSNLSKGTPVDWILFDQK